MSLTIQLNSSTIVLIVCVTLALIAHTIRKALHK